MLPLVLGLPVLAGLAATVLPAFGILPGLDDVAWGFGWAELAHAPGLSASLLLTVRTGCLATVLALGTALMLGLSPAVTVLRLAAAPMLAVPHAAMAIGLGFLVAPTGWLVRLAGLPPLGVATVGDGFGGAMILALWLKETPFLLLAVLAALGQTQLRASRVVASMLGYAPWRATLLVVVPRIWPQMRLPVLAVLAFSLSVVDVAVVLGPQTPPTLAVRILRWSSEADLARWPQAAAASLLLTGLVLVAFATCLGFERGVALLGRAVLRRGARGQAAAAEGPAAALAIALALALAALAAGACLTLVLWAGAASWRFPASWPQGWTVARLARGVGGLGAPAGNTVWIAVAATVLALVVAVAALRSGPVSRLAWLPLLLPQAGFLFGWQILLVRCRLDGSAVALVWSHLVFVLPYVLLGLAGPWRALDGRYARAAASLGATPWRVLTRVTLPLLATPLAAAAAVGFAVSVGLYLPTLFAGAGRFATLATEAVSLSAGGDRRVLAATALAQAALPLAAFAAAFARRPPR